MKFWSLNVIVKELYVPFFILTKLSINGVYKIFEPKVVLIGVESKISFTEEIALSTKLQRIMTPLTIDPTAGKGGVYPVRELPPTEGGG